MKHTPGPWLVNEAQDNTESHGRLYIDSQDENYVGIVSMKYGPHDKIERIRKDAQLIASAPDLLAACKEALGSTNEFEMGEALDIVEKAVVKAEGGTK